MNLLYGIHSGIHLTVVINFNLSGRSSFSLSPPLLSYRSSPSSPRLLLILRLFLFFFVYVDLRDLILARVRMWNKFLAKREDQTLRARASLLRCRTYLPLLRITVETEKYSSSSSLSSSLSSSVTCILNIYKCKRFKHSETGGIRIISVKLLSVKVYQVSKLKRTPFLMRE